MDEFDKLADKLEELETRVFAIYEKIDEDSSIKTLYACICIYRRLKKLVEVLKMYHVDELRLGNPIKYKKLHKNTTKKVLEVEKMIEELEKDEEKCRNQKTTRFS